MSNKVALPQHSTTSASRKVKSTSLVRNLFYVKARQAPLAGRVKFYSKNWEKLTQYVNILSITQGSKIPFSQTPFQYGPPPPQLAKVNQEEKDINKFKNKENVEERCNSTGEIRAWVNLF